MLPSMHGTTSFLEMEADYSGRRLRRVALGQIGSHEQGNLSLFHQHRPPSFPSSPNRVQQRETLSGRIDCPPSAVSAVHEWPNSVNSGFSLKLSISARSALHCSPLPPPASLFSHRNIKSLLLLLLLDKSHHRRRRRRRMLPERGAKSIMMPNDI